MKNKVVLKCSTKNCPRKRKIEFDKVCFPVGTVTVISRCPWHADGDFDNEQYFDKEGNELYWQPDFIKKINYMKNEIDKEHNMRLDSNNLDAKPAFVLTLLDLWDDYSSDKEELFKTDIPVGGSILSADGFISWLKKGNR